MTGKFIFILMTFILLLGVLLLFILKSGLQMQYIRIQQKKKPGSPWDYLKFSFSDEKARKLRVQAFLLFPMLYPIVLDDDKEELNLIKRKVKRIHMGIYGLLILLIILGIYSERVFANS